MRFWTVSLLVVLSVIGIALSDTNNYFFFAGFVVLQAVEREVVWYENSHAVCCPLPAPLGALPER